MTKQTIIIINITNMLSPIGGFFVQAEFNDLMALVSIVMRDKRVGALKCFTSYIKVEKT